ncbi:MAG TPA: MarR family winged helix-turn-helix transcriptional regulator [Beijerinckiaceae bacterium]|nr:MarR family winged helix-turn-helix transcriptional regulator [Beijerinckiaceae bacterium]
MTELKGKSIGHHLQLAARMHRARVAAAIQDLGLFPGQEQVLFALEAGDDMTVGQLARDLLVRPPTISKTLQRLALQGLVRRAEHENDARRSTVALTKEGRRRTADLASRIDAVEEDLLAHFDGKEQRRLRKLLKRAAKALSSNDADADHEADEDDPHNA